MIESALALGLLAFFSYVIKGATGFGGAIVFVALGSLVVGVKDAVAVAAVLDIASGLMMLRITSASDLRGFWGPLLISVALGSLLGSAAFLLVPARGLNLSIGVVILAVGLWFVAGRPGIDRSELTDAVPARPDWKAHAASLLSGFSGGFVGMSGPPMVLYLGSWLKKSSFRRLLVPLLLGAALVRAVPYTLSGVIDGDLLLLSLVGLPPLFIGPYVGDRLFKRLPERWFVRAVGALLLAIGLKWIAS